MQIIPVLDLLGGQVVHAAGGNRAGYQPITSQLCASADPLEVAQAIWEQFGLAEFYLADLDALTGGLPQWEWYQRLAKLPVQWLVDCGPQTKEQVGHLVDAWDGKLAQTILSLESLSTPQQLAGLIAAVGVSSLTFSLDLRRSVPLATRDWPDDPLKIAELAVGSGIHRLIVLELAAVGGEQGPGTMGLCQAIRQRFPLIHLASGGGVRHLEDVQDFQAAGCDAVLVATALHRGQLGPGDLRVLRG